jgi:hypothetical protein
MRRCTKTAALLVVLTIAVIATYEWRLASYEKGVAAGFAAEHVSLVNLIATPEKYDGKLVMVEGVCAIEFEGYALYLSNDDRKHRVGKNAVWAAYYTLVNVDNPLTYKLDGRYVLVEGYFDAKSHGHMGIFSGSITNVTRILTW